VLSLLDEGDYRVRLNAIQLVDLMVDNCINQMQECILANPEGVARLMESLADTKEVIRNEVRKQGWWR
jgi:hypothetical protein